MTEIISISDDVYASLTKIKGKDSYSYVIRKLLTEKTNKDSLMEFFGKGGIDESKVKELSKGWKKWSGRYV